MKELEKLFLNDPYSLNKDEKDAFFKSYLNKLTLHHYNKSTHYKKFLNYLGYSKKNEKIDLLPYLPVRAFKELDLVSVDKKKIIKVLNSSGTTGNKRSKIYLDKKNALNQIKALQKIIYNVLGKDRLPMLIVEKNIKNIDRRNFDAKIAAINGFSTFGKNHFYLLDEENNINYKQLNTFLSNFSKKKFFIFGFTSSVFENLFKKLDTKKINYNFKNAILLHGGGWKKLEKKKISNKIFKEKLKNKLNLKNIYNYYGMIEQTGSIFIECKCGFFITSNYSDILIRDENFKVLEHNQKGFIQLLSLLPSSYPGHNIITEDMGEIVNNANCKCSINGKRFLVHGRAQEAEIRGCSNI